MSAQTSSFDVMKTSDNQSRRAKPTPADLRAAKKLREAWDARPKELKLTQEAMAARMGGSQPLVSQYLLGRIPLNFRALMQFSEALGIDPHSIRSDLPEQSMTGITSASQDRRPDFGKLSDAVTVLWNYLHITGGKPEWISDTTLLEIAYAVVSDFGEAVSPNNVIVLTRTLGETIRNGSGNFDEASVDDGAANQRTTVPTRSSTKPAGRGGR